MTEKPTDSKVPKVPVKKERRRTTIKKRLILKHFLKNAGNITVLCDQARIARKTYRAWRSGDPNFAEEIEEREEGLLDFSESKLFSMIDKEVPSAVIFHLKTKGRKRGYVEHVEHSIPDGIQSTHNITLKITHTRQDDSEMIDEIEAEIRKELLGEDASED